MTKPLIEVLTFEGCPNAEPALAFVGRILAELGLDADVRRIDVPDVEAATEQRFLGSPTIRVDGRDIEPDADQRDDYVLACRIYRTGRGVSGKPDERWLRDTLTAQRRGTSPSS